MKDIPNKTVNKVVIVGGGTAGWMTAAALSKVLSKLDITLVESAELGTIGVGEATIPTIQFFNGLLGIPPHEFLQKTMGTYKLGINFENWHEQGKDYFHAFGSTGKSLWAAGFHDFWRKGLDKQTSENFSTYNLEAIAAKAGKFDKGSTGLNYAYHLDAGLYAKLLREHAEQQGVKRIEGKITQVETDPLSGEINSVQLENGQRIEGELFIDCSGFRGLLINETLQTPFIDWSHYLPCDSAFAVQTEAIEEAKPYTRSIAHQAGWRWRIPLQHRVGNGIVFSSQHMSDDEARQLLLSQVDGKLINEPRLIRFKTGYREKLWHLNCVAIGLAGGFIEPLESTAIHLIQQGILRLIKLFPSKGIEPLDVAEYNKSAQSDFEQIRDFIVLHYHQTQREDSSFWRYCKNMEIPDSLSARMQLFKQTGRFIQRQEELFVDSWLQVMIGQGLIPDKYHRIVDEMTDAQLQGFLTNIQQSIGQQVDKLGSHQDYLARHCQAVK